MFANPKLWKDEQLDPEVWLALNKIAKEWAKFANIPNKAIKDIIIVSQLPPRVVSYFNGETCLLFW